MYKTSTFLSVRSQFEQPLVNLAFPTAFRMWAISGCLFMAVLQSASTDSLYSLWIALCAVAAGLLTEFLVLFKRGKLDALKDGSALASALLLTLLLPNQIPLVYAAAGSIFAMAVVKHSFGGLGANFLNPALAGWFFVRFSWAASFYTGAVSASYPMHAFSPPNWLNSLLSGVFSSLTSINPPAGYINTLVSSSPAIIADRGVLALLLGIIVLCVTKVIRISVPLIFLAAFGLLIRYAGDLFQGEELWEGNVFFAICSGGTLVTAFFLVSDPATSAKSNGGTLFTALAGGILAFLFRFYGESLYGALFAVLFINTVVPLLRVFERKTLYERHL